MQMRVAEIFDANSLQDRDVLLVCDVGGGTTVSHQATTNGASLITCLGSLCSPGPKSRPWGSYKSRTDGCCARLAVIPTVRGLY
jgi:hypothetical protein